MVKVTEETNCHSPLRGQEGLLASLDWDVIALPDNFEEDIFFVGQWGDGFDKFEDDFIVETFEYFDMSSDFLSIIFFDGFEGKIEKIFDLCFFDYGLYNLWK